jgi:septal ring factor EnvC (AmiA/AmiB activator)
MSIHIRTILITLFLILSAHGLSAQDPKSYEEKKARLEREIEIINKQLSENSSQSSRMLSNLNLVRKKVANRKELVSESDRQIKKYKDQIYLAQFKINKMQARVDTLSDHYSKMLLSAYKNRDARVWYMYMLASDDMGQAFRRMSYFRNLSSQLNAEAKEIRKAKEEMEQEKERLTLMKKEAEDVKAERVKELDKLKKEENQADNVVKNLKKDRKKYQKQLSAKNKEVEALNREMKKLVDQAMKGKGGSSASKKTEVDVKLAAEFSANKGKLPWPADGPVVDKFGKHYHPVYKNLQLPPNNGVDIALSPGTDVKAVFNGTVSQVLVMPGYNQCVLIQHGNYFTFYCKLKSVSVKAGEKVTTGQKIGVVDTMNGTTQLHFETWKNTSPQNPENWLK